VSEALSAVVARNDLTLGRFRALLALDQLARSLGDALLSDFAEGRAPSSPPESNSWQSAYALCRSFGQAFEYALRHILEGKSSRGWCEHVPAVLLRLFQHRQLEFLLRPYVNEHSLADCWNALHGAYRYAESAGVHSQPVALRRCRKERAEASTLEREYIHVLLLPLLNDGRRSPCEAFWLHQRIPGWCAVLSLQSENAGPAADAADRRFAVDLEGAAGLVRPSRKPAGTQRYLDPGPMLALIQDEIASFRDPARPVDRLSPFGRGRQLKLLRAVRTILLPRPAPTGRRGERLPAASTVEAIVGFSRIARALRHGQRGSAGAERVWQLKDRSESGCRLRGKIGEQPGVLPGALVAFREHGDAPWTLAVVRRIRKRIGDRVDIGVECLGQDPVVVALAADNDGTVKSNASTDRKRRHCIALYLREGFGHPRLPFGTLMLPPREFKAGRRLSLKADDVRHTVRLKEPLEEQDGFVWSPYEVVFRLATDRKAQGQPDDRRQPIGLVPNHFPLSARTAGSADAAVPMSVRRRGEDPT